MKKRAKNASTQAIISMMFAMINLSLEFLKMFIDDASKSVVSVDHPCILVYRSHHTTNLAFTHSNIQFSFHDRDCCCSNIQMIR